jgi:hypothetical protein
MAEEELAGSRKDSGVGVGVVCGSAVAKGRKARKAAERSTLDSRFVLCNCR